ncbi:WxL domain-containing protein [Vagococcus silagei]|uniref:WxL domain-containing protein n=1 Tax=Vagococcus silagei TaxID=2508885 RepID=A0A4V3TUT0_9ENTE|nr:WxL domain-containing protein [Vagococcus silagei]THB60109.1 hypothetical protein ESZ54_12190 [Vagococcus silagei]
MKKSILLFASTLTVLGLATIGNTAEAAPTDTKDAKFKLTKADDGTGYDVTASNLDFTQQKSSASMIETTSSAEHKISVNDFSGSNSGWNLKVSVGDFKGKLNNVDVVLAGAEIEFPADPTIDKVEGDTASAANFLPVANTLKIKPGEAATTLAKAAANKGQGKWDIVYPAGTIKLKAGSGNTATDYTAKLTYTLSATPDA